MLSLGQRKEGCDEVHQSRTGFEVRDLANFLRCHPGTIYRLLRRRELTGVKVGSRWRVGLKRVDEWLRRQDAPARRDVLRALKRRVALHRAQ